MSQWQKSVETLIVAQKALASGNFKMALQHASESVGLEATIEGYFCKAEALYLAGDAKGALQDLLTAKDLCQTQADIEYWKEPLEHCYSRIQEALEAAKGPPVSQYFSVLLATPLADEKEIFRRIIANPDLSTDGKTLVRKGESAVYDINILDLTPELAKTMVEMADGQLAPAIVEGVKKSERLLCIGAPNKMIAQKTESQTDLAVEFIALLEPLILALDAPLALLPGSNSIITFDKVEAVLQNTRIETVIDFYVKLINTGTSLFSVGMHQLGFEDSAIPLTVMSSERALELLGEFMMFQVANNLVDVVDKIEYESITSGAVYTLERKPEERFTAEGDERYNKFGVWHFSLPKVRRSLSPDLIAQ